MLTNSAAIATVANAVIATASSSVLDLDFCESLRFSAILFSVLLHVTDGSVTADAGHGFAIVTKTPNVGDDLFMALQAGGLRHVEVSLRYVNLLGKAAGGECERVKEAIYRLGQTVRRPP
jgi:hypothetical protein